MHERPTDELRREHELILLVVGAMEREAGAIEAGAPVNRVRVAQMMDFARNFTDGCHHRKEEEMLFPALADRSGAATEPVRTLLSDHRAGRDAVSEVDRALPDVDVDERDRTVVADNLRHPALRAIMTRLTHVVVPQRLLLCGTHHVAAAVERLAAARRRLNARGAP